MHSKSLNPSRKICLGLVVAFTCAPLLSQAQLGVSPSQNAAFLTELRARDPKRAEENRDVLVTTAKSWRLAGLCRALGCLMPIIYVRTVWKRIASEDFQASINSADPIFPLGMTVLRHLRHPCSPLLAGTLVLPGSSRSSITQG